MNIQSADHSSQQEREKVLRERLGIPDDAERVILFAESSHWDPNWMLTSEEYFRRLVCPNLDHAIDGLLSDPRRVYSIECIFFLRMYWERRPEQQDNIRSLVNKGRLRLTSSGVTTADTLLPGTEAILRDFLVGQEWLRTNGMTQEPRVAYFPDSFGHSPALPSLLKAAGFDFAAITRIDGMYFPGADYEMPRRFPRPGSSAAMLLKDRRTLDFVWRSPDGSEVLCHWNAFTYGQGDMLAHRGIIRVYLFPVNVKDRSDRNVSHKIRTYAAQLVPYSRTPYLFCPIGFDFVSPIPDLVGLLDRFNRNHYPRTGLWAVNAGLDDYMALIDCYRTSLPVLEFDPNPYWTGFYTSRPALKKRCHDAARRLVLAERLMLLPGNDGAGKGITGELEHAWWNTAVSNHHDFITGTAKDKVVSEEQIPWLEQALTAADAAVACLKPEGKSSGHRSSESGPVELPEWQSSGGRIEVYTPHYVVELDENAGGGITGAWCPNTQRPLLKGVSGDLICYRDSGGLWRMGHEYRGGFLREVAKASDQKARLEVSEHKNGLMVTCATSLEGEQVRRSLWFSGGSPAIRLRVEGRAPRRRTISLRFFTGLAPYQLIMDVPGGVVVRPLQKWYSPTFWPLQSFVHVQEDDDGRALAFCPDMPGAVSCNPDGRLELIALRNAVRERAFGFLPLLGMPVSGHERDGYAFDCTLIFTRTGTWRDNEIPLIARTVTGVPWDDTDDGDLRGFAESHITADRPDVEVTAAKPANRGEGVIVRLSTFNTPEAPVALTVREGTVDAAFLCDARERDLKPLEVRSGVVHLSMPGSIATVRLILKKAEQQPPL